MCNNNNRCKSCTTCKFMNCGRKPEAAKKQQISLAAEKKIELSYDPVDEIICPYEPKEKKR